MEVDSRPQNNKNKHYLLTASKEVNAVIKILSDTNIVFEFLLAISL